MREENKAIYTITLLSILAFYLWMTTYAVLVFQQFDTSNIIYLSLVFLNLLLILSLVFTRDFFGQKLQFKLSNLLYTLLVLLLMILLSSAQNPGFSSYYHTFPLLETELGLGWHKDTAFHTSIIQSIINFGYPSIAQHDTPVLIYHTLSHYIDAVILIITGIEPYDAYTLMYHFKVFLFLGSILVFIGYILRRNSRFLFLLSLFIFTPVVIGTWHAIGSHSLWFTSILLILSAPRVYMLLVHKEKNTLHDYIFLFTLVILLALGKISTGFMYATFIGIFLLIKQPKEIKVYLLGIVWVLFFLLYKTFMLPPNGSVHSLDLHMNFLLHPTPMLLSIYTSIGILSAITFILKGKNNQRLLLTSIGSLLLLFFILTITKLAKPDIFYFQYGFGSFLILFVFQSIIDNINSYQEQIYIRLSETNAKLIKTTTIMSALLLTSFYALPSLNFYTFSAKSIEKHVKSLNHQPFSSINSKIDPKEQFQVKDVFFEKRLDISRFHNKRVLLRLRKRLKTLIRQEHLGKKKVRLYIPKEIYQNELAVFRGTDWARGMLIYAITGVPLVHGLQKLREDYAYGYFNYDKRALWTAKNTFDPKKVCLASPIDAIIIIDALSELELSLYRCQNK